MKEIATHNLGSPVYCSPVFANGVLYIMNREQLFAIETEVNRFTADDADERREAILI